MMIDTMQIKVEPCKSAGPKMKKQRTESNSQSIRKSHSGAAPKVKLLLGSAGLEMKLSRSSTDFLVGT